MILTSLTQLYEVIAQARFRPRRLKTQGGNLYGTSRVKRQVEKLVDKWTNQSRFAETGGAIRY